MLRIRSLYKLVVWIGYRIASRNIRSRSERFSVLISLLAYSQSPRTPMARLSARRNIIAKHPAAKRSGFHRGHDGCRERWERSEWITIFIDRPSRLCSCHYGCQRDLNKPAALSALRRSPHQPQRTAHHEHGFRLSRSIPKRSGVDTGQRNLDGLGLMDYHARMYDAVLGRFISPDTITPGGRKGLTDLFM